MKSHLAYRWLLGRIDEDDGARGLVISLRDEETAAIATLESISKAEGLKREIRPLMSDARLMILHLWPGYMPPEEFMHNVVVRLRATNPQLCVINGIDHIPARLPLCAALDTFVPALASLLSHHEVTSVFAATEETPGALSTLGLLPMADLVLRFSEVRGVPKQEACLLEGVEQVARVTAERVPAGGIGGRHGYLCRDEDPGRLAFRAPDRRAGDTWTE